MTKQEQRQVNETVIKKIDEFNSSPMRLISKKTLRNCNAEVYKLLNKETGEIIYALKSYNTVIAFAYGNCVYDFLRLVYGYTATSAKHISKFIHDYIDCWYYETKIYRYYPLGGLNMQYYIVPSKNDNIPS